VSVTDVESVKERRLLELKLKSSRERSPRMVSLTVKFRRFVSVSGRSRVSPCERWSAVAMTAPSFEIYCTDVTLLGSSTSILLTLVSIGA
jgi:hypothetical protein